MSFSTAIRKARDIGRRTVALAHAPAAMVQPRAHHAFRVHDGVLVLGRGENASVDYYLRPRLHGEAGPVEFADLNDDPGSSRLLANVLLTSLLVIVCRYASTPWIEALEAARPRIARLAFFADDDLPAMITDRSLPLAARGKVAEGFAVHADRLSSLAGEVWLSTRALADRYPESLAAVLGPLPEADPPQPASRDERLIVYHGTDVHRRERAFALDVAERLQGMGCTAPVEITGDASLARRCTALPHVTVRPQLPWPDYLAHNSGRRAALFLSPLSASRVNASRAPVKAFDAARLGATGLFADREPYRSVVEEGVTGRLLPDDPQLWAEEILALLADPVRRDDMAAHARAKLIHLRRADAGLPAPPSAP